MSMYPPKSKTSKMSDAKREKLLNIQKREQLKGMLINKFKDKYRGKKNSEFINQEVQNFLTTEKLTEANLNKLEQKIEQQANRDGDAQSVASSQKKAPSVISGRSVQSSKMSGGSRLSSKASQKAPSQRDDDAQSVASNMTGLSMRSKQTVSSVAVSEDDEWAAILKFNTYLAAEEERQQAIREKEQKMRIKAELDKQLSEKQRLIDEERQQTRLYEEAQASHITALEQKEKDKERKMKEKVMQEKKMRDKQLKAEAIRKKKDMDEQRRLDYLTVKRLQEELETEKKIDQERKRQERAHLQQVLRENEDRKKLVMAITEKERQADIKAQQEYTRMLEKQEADRAAEVANRENRAQEFMAQMADTVIKMQDQKAVEHERNMIKAQQEKEYRDRLEDEARKLRLQKNKEETKQFLEMQIQEKRERKELERKIRQEQAEIWKKDTEDFFQNESSKKQKEKQINLAHQDILRKQMAEHISQKKARNMNREELKMNRQLLKEIQHKQKSPAKEEEMPADE